MKMEFKNVLLGIVLVITLWFVNLFIAFGIFSPIREDTKIIVFSWLIVDTLIIYTLIRKKKFNKKVVLGMCLVVGVLVVLYLIPINNNIPQEVLDLNKEISDKNLDRYNYAEELFFVVEGKYASPIRQYLLQPNRIFFIKDFSKLWNKTGYVDSSLQTQIYRNLLLKERFNEPDIMIINGFCTNSPHRYLKFENGDFADLWAVDNFENYKFGQYSPFPCNELLEK